jgi:predicted ribonuclease YlaK
MSYFGISSRNQAQKRAFQALANDKPFTFLTGPAGTGKSLLAQAVGMDDVIEERNRNKLVYTRLQMQVGLDVGALPGNVDEKTFPFVAPFMDNLEIMTGNPSEFKRYFTEGDESKRRIFFDPIQTVRGRSMHHTFLMLDEVQNLDIHTIAAIATRPGINAKFVFMGNFSQIDSAKLRNTKTNGLYRLLSGLYEADAHEYFDHINLTEVLRHPVVQVVEDILRDEEILPEFEALEARGNYNEGETMI